MINFSKIHKRGGNKKFINTFKELDVSQLNNILNNLENLKKFIDAEDEENKEYIKNNKVEYGRLKEADYVQNEIIDKNIKNELTQKPENLKQEIKKNEKLAKKKKIKQKQKQKRSRRSKSKRRLSKCKVRHG